MSRISALLVAAGLAAGTVGCAQCDTCDDFPAPCTGPNCGGGGYGASAVGYTGPMNPPDSAGTMPPAAPGSANDAAPKMPNAADAPAPPANDRAIESSPPKPTEPGPSGL